MKNEIKVLIENIKFFIAEFWLDILALLISILAVIANILDI